MKLEKLRNLMNEAGIDYYVIPTDDFHASEYVGDYFQARAYISGFSGSAGTLLAGKEFAGLWTDGRYFLQASMQLEGSGIYFPDSDHSCGTCANDAKPIRHAFF